MQTDPLTLGQSQINPLMFKSEYLNPEARILAKLVLPSHVHWHNGQKMLSCDSF